MLRGDTQGFPEGDTEINHREEEQMKTNEVNLYNQIAFFCFCFFKKANPKRNLTKAKTLSKLRARSSNA